MISIRRTINQIIIGLIPVYLFLLFSSSVCSLHHDFENLAQQDGDASPTGDETDHSSADHADYCKFLHHFFQDTPSGVFIVKSNFSVIHLIAPGYLAPDLRFAGVANVLRGPPSLTSV
jgi:hypothetical protein